MNEQNRQKVLDYINKFDIDPLYFYPYPEKGLFDECENTTKLIIMVGKLQRSHQSYNYRTKGYETSADHWRSVLDIWRHVIYFKSDVTIFDVMHELYNLYHVPGGFSGQFCDVIKRRSFRNYRDGEIPNTTNYMLPEPIIKQHGVPYDEFGLVWEDWEDI